MNAQIKGLLKKTPFYSVYRAYQHHTAVKNFWNWTDDDEKSAGFYRQFIERGDLVFDVGANLGNRSKVFYKLDAQVVAFEPQTDCQAFLKTVFKGKNAVRVIDRALGAACGSAEMLVGDTNTLSSLSAEWISAVTNSLRFSGHRWDKRQTVEMMTLDNAIREFGVPKFIKIDVEGYEAQVLSGLSSPVKCISIEFTPELIESTLECIDRLSCLSAIEVNISFGESLAFASPSWHSPANFKRLLAREDHRRWGDVYIRCCSESLHADRR
jgi:FkbM family methyltransferase